MVMNGQQSYFLAKLITNRKRIPVLSASQYLIGTAVSVLIYNNVNVDECEFKRTHHLHDAAVASAEARSTGSSTLKQRENHKETTTEYDFVIVGNGLAGKTATRTLERICPNASIVVIDPFNEPSSTAASQNNTSDLSKNTCYISQAVVQLDTASKEVKLSPPSSSSSSPIRYKHSILLATGSRGAPPPMSLFDPEAFSRVLELRSTILPVHCCRDTTTSVTMSSDSYKRAALHSMATRNLAIRAASQKAHLTILGSGIEAIELAAAAAAAVSVKTENNKVALVFGNAGPMATKLPLYLSTEITKRLRQSGIDVYNRHVVRYVASAAAQQQQQDGAAAVEVHIARVSDSLDTKRLSTDLLLVAPPVDELHGSASLPFPPDRSESSLALKSVPSVWSQKVTNGTVTCHSTDGRIMVNTELCAANDVYAAGSVARYPNHACGKSIVCGGRGQSDTIHAGEIAASNMASQYYKYNNNGMIFSDATSPSTVGAVITCATTTFNHRFPILRTDILPYSGSFFWLEPQRQQRSQSLFVSSALSSIGVHALLIGDCNSEEMSSHGFWWTNRSSRKRDREQQHLGSKLLNYIEDSPTEDDDSDSPEANPIVQGDGSNGSVIKLMTRSSVNLVNRKSCVANNSIHPTYYPSRPVYGSGVVFYLDRTSKLAGCMTWGVPFTEPSVTPDKVNEKLLSYIQTLLESQCDSDSILSVADLANESKRIMTIACSGKTITENVFCQDGKIAKPLHRFSPSRGNKLDSSLRLHRHANGEVVEDDEIYVRSFDEAFFQSYSSLLNQTGTISQDGYSNSAKGTPHYHPLKEDLLWIQHDGMNRLLSTRDVHSQLFYHNIRQGRFSDGTDPVELMQQLPRKTKARFRSE